MNENNDLNNQNVQPETPVVDTVATSEVAPVVTPEVTPTVSTPAEEAKVETKSNKGVVIVLIVVIVALACGLGYMIYLSSNTKCDCSSNDETTTTATASSVTVSDVMKTLVGTWSWKGDKPIGLNESNEDCYETITLVLKDDGTYTIGHGALGCAEYYEGQGNYYLSNDKIYLVNDECPYELVDETNYVSSGNCFTDYILDYSDGSISYNGNVLTLEN